MGCRCRLSAAAGPAPSLAPPRSRPASRLEPADVAAELHERVAGDADTAVHRDVRERPDQVVGELGQVPVGGGVCEHLGAQFRDSAGSATSAGVLSLSAAGAAAPLAVRCWRFASGSCHVVLHGCTSWARRWLRREPGSPLVGTRCVDLPRSALPADGSRAARRFWASAPRRSPARRGRSGHRPRWCRRSAGRARGRG